MASTQTPHYHLNQWISTDAVQRVEFNQNFTAIDTALHTLDQNLLLKGSAADLAELSATVSALSGGVAGKAAASALGAACLVVLAVWVWQRQEEPIQLWECANAT